MATRIDVNSLPTEDPLQRTTKKTESRFHTSTNRSAFTLVELLVVVSIIALLISILLPSLQGARDQAKLLKCGTNLAMFGKALNIYANEYDDAVPRGIWELGSGSDDVAREFYWELFWPYLNLPDAPTYQDKLKYASDAGVLRCPAYRLPDDETSAEWKQARSYAVNEKFQPEPERNRFGQVIYPQPLGKIGFIRHAGETCYAADTSGDSRLTRKDVALLFDPPPLGMRTDPKFNPRHRKGKVINVLYLDSHVESTTLGKLPPLNNPTPEADYYEAHIFWNGRESMNLVGTP